MSPMAKESTAESNKIHRRVTNKESVINCELKKPFRKENWENDRLELKGKSARMP